MPDIAPGNAGHKLGNGLGETGRYWAMLAQLGKAQYCQKKKKLDKVRRENSRQLETRESQDSTQSQAYGAVWYGHLTKTWRAGLTYDLGTETKYFEHALQGTVPTQRAADPRSRTIEEAGPVRGW